MNTKKPLCATAGRVVPWLALALAFALSIGSLALYGRHNLNSDMSSEMVLANLLNEEGRLLSENWYYSTELRVISTVPAFQIGLAVFPHDWHAARVLGAALMMALVGISCVYMCRGQGMRSGAIWAAAAILTPFGSIYKHLFLHGAYYAGYTIVAFLLLGSLLRLGKGKRYWAVLAVLGIYAGLGGVRMLMMLCAPLLLVCMLEAYGVLRRSDTLRQAATSEEMTLFAGSLLLAGCMLAGYLLNSAVLEKIYHFRSYQGETLGAIDLNLLSDQVKYWLMFFGFSSGKALLSFEGIAHLLGLGIALLLPFCVAALIMRRAQLPVHTRLVPGVAAAAVLLGMLINMLIYTGSQSGAYSPSYYMIGIHVTIVAAFLLLERMPCRMQAVRQLSMAALCGVFLLQGLVCVRDMRASRANYEDIAAFLREQGYTQGYANFWEANLLTEASDGELEVWVIENFKTGEPYKWLQRVDHVTREPEGRVFAVLDGYVDQPDAFGPYLQRGFYEVQVFGFESAEQFRDVIRDAAQTDAQR